MTDGCRLTTPATYVDLSLPKPAGDDQCFAGNPGSVFRREEDSCRSDVCRLSEATEWRQGLRLLAEVTVSNSGRIQTFRDNHARVDSVNADIAGRQFLGQ